MNFVFESYKSEIESDLINKIEPLVEAQGLKLCDVEVRSALIRIYLESPEGLTAYIGIKDCEKVHRLVGPMFDVWDPISSAYTLEVSTPGEDTPLRALRHFREAVGQFIEFQTTEALEMPAPSKPRLRWKGCLKALVESENKIVVTDDMGEHCIPISLVKSARWHRQWAPEKKEKKGKGKNQ